MIPSHTEKLLRLVLRHDARDELSWNLDRQGNGKFCFFINCNDQFWWAVADAEQITEENLPVLEECLQISSDWGCALFCSRVRGMRPQGAFYAHVDKGMWSHFDACGPERDVDKEPFGNPFEQGVTIGKDAR